MGMYYPKKLWLTSILSAGFHESAVLTLCTAFVIMNITFWRFPWSSPLSLPTLTIGLGHNASGPYHCRRVEDKKDLCLHTASANTMKITASGSREAISAQKSICDLLLGFVKVSNFLVKTLASESSNLNTTVWSLIVVWVLALNQNL